MKKLYNPLATGGAPVFTETLNNTELELWAAVEGILKHLDPTLAYPPTLQAAPATNYISTGIIVSGGDVTDNTTDWDLAAGIAYFPVAGRFARFAAEATIDNADYAMITLDSPVTTQKTFFDAANKDYFVEYDASVATLTPPAAAPGVEYVSVRKAAVLSGYPTSLMGHPYFGNIINQINKWTVDDGEIAATMATGWTDTGETWYRKLGGVVFVSLGFFKAASPSDLVFTLPVGYRPSIGSRSIAVAYGQTSTTLYTVEVSPSGTVTVHGSSTPATETIDGQFSFISTVYD